MYGGVLITHKVMVSLSAGQDGQQLEDRVIRVRLAGIGAYQIALGRVFVRVRLQAVPVCYPADRFTKGHPSRVLLTNLRER